MYKFTVKVDGMMCNMCEAHVNEAIRKAAPSAKKVKSSHKNKETVFLNDEMIDEETLKKIINDTGYTYVSSEVSEYVKKSLFGR